MRVRAHAPGRVNVIGDHTDTTGGFVLPMAIHLGTTVDLEQGGEVVSLSSGSFTEPAEVALAVGDPSTVSPDWARYVAGVVAEVRPAVGGRGTVSTTLPVGAGLSSSAALEVAVALALGFEGTPHELALACQRAEQRASGVPCGIMDQRRAGCEGAEERIGPLRDASLADVVALPDDLRPLARHVVSENARVRAFVEALRAGDLAGAGGLMVESHASLRDDFAVSTPRLDALVDRLRATPGVFGARLTGAGFGGCVVALCEPGVDVGGWVLRPSAGARRGFEPDGAR